MKSNLVYYYSDEVNDDFAGTNIRKKEISADYEYLNRGFFRHIRRFFIYHCFVKAATFFYLKFIKRVKFVGKKKMRGYKKQGAFIYGNHTSLLIDAINPTYLAYPRDADVIVNADAVSIKGLGWLLKTIGALPIPEGYHAMSRFNAAVEEAIEKKHWVAIYPEAHIWHYYTKIRPFAATSFAYPVKCGAPVFSYTMVYQKRKHSKHPKRIVYVDGPFLPDGGLTRKEAAKKLRQEVYSAMCERAKLNTCEYVKYVYRPKEETEI